MEKERKGMNELNFDFRLPSFNEADFDANLNEISGFDDEDLLSELASLSGTSIAQLQQSPSRMPAIPQGNFGMIRVAPDAVSNDFDVGDVILTAEDENNPELLAELAALNLNGDAVKVDEDLNEAELRELIADLKKSALALKRDGDLEAAKLRVQEISRFEYLLSKFNTQVPIDKHEVSVTLNMPLQRQETTTINKDQVVAVQKSKDVAIYRDLFVKLQKQVASCASIYEHYASENRKSDSVMFQKRKQALELDLQKLRAMLKNKQPPPAVKSVEVAYEFSLINPSMPEGELHVTISNFKVLLPKKCKLKSDAEYRIRLNYELFGLNEKEQTLLSEPFILANLEKDSLGPFIFKCNRRDIRVVKSVEYKKLKIEIVVEEGFLFFKSLVSKASGHVKFDELMKECTVNELMELFEISSEGKKSSIPTAQLALSAKIRNPLSSIDGVRRVIESWTLIPSFGHSNHVLYPQLTPPARPSILQSKEAALTGTWADNVRSFEVIEHELGQLQGNAALLQSNPNLDIQVSLEALRDRLQMQVELGEISLEDYLQDVRKCIAETKNFALQAKRMGNVVLAQRYVRHVDIMRKEIIDAEEGNE